MFVWSKIPPHWGAGRVWGHPLWSSWSAMQVCPLSVVPWRNPLIWQFGFRTRALACGLSSCPCQASPVAAIVVETALHLRQTSVLHPSSSSSTSLPAHCHHFTHSISCWTFLNPNTKSVKILTHLDLQHWKIPTCEISCLKIAAVPEQVWQRSQVGQVTYWRCQTFLQSTDYE